MKNIIIAIIGCIYIICTGVITAQTPSNRSVSTVIADVLAQLPAARSNVYNQSMKELMATGTEGVMQLVAMLHAPGKGDNAAVEYALSGMAYFASGDKSLKVSMEQALLASLDATGEPETKAFIMRLLAITGSDAGIQKLAAYLTDDRLCGQAASAITSIGGESAGKSLQMTLMRRMARSPESERSIIQALGDALPVVEGTEALLKTMVATNDVTTKGIALKALSKTGTRQSLAELAVAAASTGYRAEITDANGANIRLIKRVYEQGDTKEAMAAAQNMLKNATKANSHPFRVAALEILFYNRTDALKTLKNALKDDDKAFRNAALNFASSAADKAMYADLLKSMAKAKTAEKIDVLYWIGNEARCPEKREMLKSTETSIDKTGLQTLTQLLDDPHIEVKKATTIALGAIGDPSTLPALTEQLKSRDTTVLAFTKETLASFPGNLFPALTKSFSQASDGGKIVVMELLAARKANAYFTLVLDQTKSTNPDVQRVALNTLQDVASEKDVVVLCGMLETATPSSVAPLQQAVAASIASLLPEKQTETITNRILQAGDEKKYLYYPVLAATNDPKALALINKGLDEGSNVSREAAFNALLLWKGFEVEEALYGICKNSSASFVGKAVDAYISLASDRSLTGDNRLIFLRKAMGVAKTNEQKNSILENIGQTGTFLAMLYAGKYLDDSGLKENAAQAVMQIALANAQFTGTMVKALLQKAAATLNNPDADYQRQAIRKHLDAMPDEVGFVSIFNGKDLTGWKGLVANPIKRAAMKPAELMREQAKADEIMRSGWAAVDGELVFNGKGDNICTEKLYGDFEMYVDWKLDPAGHEPDAGIYLRGTPQVQIWDTSRVNVGAQVGSGGLYNNQTHVSKPLMVADNKLGEWNTFYIKMVGDRVTVVFNGERVVDNIILENFWDRSLPIPAVEQIELQAHGSKVYYRDIYIRELASPEPFVLSEQEKKEGFQILFDGTNMHEWTGNIVDYSIEDGCISVPVETRFGGNLYTKKEFANFVYRFEFQLTPGANNGVGIRTPMEGDAAYVGMEIQILDSEHPSYRNLHDYQYHGSVYGIIPALRGYLKPVGEWNTEEIIADGDQIKVTLNGTVILNGNIREATANGTPDKREHPGLFNKSGHIAFLGHGSALKFRNIRIKELK